MQQKQNRGWAVVRHSHCTIKQDHTKEPFLPNCPDSRSGILVEARQGMVWRGDEGRCLLRLGDTDTATPRPRWGLQVDGGLLTAPPRAAVGLHL
jgi:hypothetical protein